MNIPQIDINYKMARIGMKWEKGSMEIQQNTPRIELDYSNSHPYQIVGDMKISNPPPEMEISYKKCLEDLGYRRLLSLVRFMVSEGKKKTLEAIQESVQDGDYLGKLELGGNRIARLARSKLREKEKELNIDSLPKQPPDIKVKTGQVQVTMDLADVNVKNYSSFPKIDIKPDRVKIYLAQKGEVEIELVEHKIDLKA